MSSDNSSGEVDRCDVCNNYDNLERIPLFRERGNPQVVDLKTCEVCESALRQYFYTDTCRSEVDE